MKGIKCMEFTSVAHWNNAVQKIEFSLGGICQVSLRNSSTDSVLKHNTSAGWPG